ncbi:ankyrin repeat-containing domain protein [Podospora aff. communis PSN243]|uniref:Ankyrin repeat-containing domain protein n=1 Tax=Podospora aff. communis PSN243 TaxID=3040156 RepID=A0AAV9G5A1_9PEZI|nr:ankyrin repeat-containing domain protein [Podospora aff. communis PSN243]
MAEPLGIIGVIGVASQIIGFAINSGLDWKEAPDDVRGFLAELAGLKTVLAESATNLARNEDFKNAFHGRHSAFLSQLASPAAQGTTNMEALLETCRQELEALLRDLEKSEKGHRMGWNRFKRAFLSSRTRESVQDVCRRCQTLNNLLSVDTLALLANTHMQITASREEQREIHGTVKQLWSHTETEQRDVLLKWLTPTDYAAQQNDYFSLRQEGTGEWLLSDSKFKNWVTSKTSTTLYCPGSPGAGKTILASIVIDHLQNSCTADDRIGLAYIYCNFRRQTEQTIDNLVSSLLKQLVQGARQVPGCVNDLYATHKSKNSRPLINELSNALHTVAEKYSRVFIVIDALDECPLLDGRRSTFLNMLFSLRRARRCNVGLLVTARPLGDIQAVFVNDTPIEIRASDEDTARFVEAKFLNCPVLSGGICSFSAKSKRSSSKPLMECIFLFAQLYVDSLKGKRSPKALRCAVAGFPKRSGTNTANTASNKGKNIYDQAYEGAMERIEGQLADEAKLAKDVLSWITHAYRPLTTQELQHALAVEVGESEFDEDSISDLDDIVSVCAGLVTVDKESNIIRLVHYTTQEYFNRTSAHWFPHAQAEIVKACTTYLTVRSIPIHDYKTQQSWKITQKLKYLPLFSYAAQYWGKHARNVDAVRETTNDFLRQPHTDLACCASVLLGRDSWATARCSIAPAGMNGFHIAAFFNLDRAIQDLCSGPEDANVFKAHLDSALHFACCEGNKEAIQTLLDKGANIEGKIARRTPLISAVKHGHEGAVRLLLAQGANIEGLDDEDYTPLVHAVQTHKHMNVVTALLENKADPNVRYSYDKRTPLHDVVYRRPRIQLDEMADLLIKYGADIEARDYKGMTPLCYAVSVLATESVEFLIEKGADVESRDIYGWRPLFWAIAPEGLTSEPRIVTALLDFGQADIEATENIGRTPLMVAAGWGNQTSIRLLIDRGADINSRSQDGRTALHFAVGSDSFWSKEERDGRIEALVELGADIDAVDPDGRTPLSIAAEYKMEPAVRLLVEKGAEVNSRDKAGRTPLSWLEEPRDLRYPGNITGMAEFLVEKGAIK